MNKKQAKTVKIYRYIPYDDQQSFDKVQSENSRPRTLACSNEYVKQASQQNSNCRLNIRLQSQPIYPLDQPQLWNVQCKSCNQQISQNGQLLNVNISHNNLIKSITPLYSGKPNLPLSYAIQYQDSRYAKFTSKALAKRHLQQMIQFLEKQVYQSQTI